MSASTHKYIYKILFSKQVILHYHLNNHQSIWICENVRVLFSTLSTYHITKRTLFEINNTDKSINLSNFTFNLLSFLFRMGVYGWMFLLVPAYRVVPDKQPLNGCCCSILTTHTASCQKDILQRNVLHEWINVSDKNAAHKRRGTCISQRTLSE